MFVTTLLCAPGSGAVTPALVENLRNAWGGGDATWLAPDEAAEFHMDHAPDNAPQVWKDVQNMGVDLIVQPAKGRRKKMLLADMDSTMIQQECIDELAAEAGIGARVAEITARSMNGELDFEAALTERVRLLVGLDASVLEHVLDTRITFMPGGKDLVQTMKANGGYCALVSGGFTTFTQRVAAELGFDEHRANTLEMETGKLTGTVRLPILGREAKLEALHDITASRGIDASEVIAVGDGMNDLLMLSNAGTGVALHGKPALQAECDLRVNFGNLTALLYIQGYTSDDFTKS